MERCTVHHTYTHECDCGETWKVGELAEAQGKLEAVLAWREGWKGPLPGLDRILSKEGNE
ncbi:hypothetical protein LCGC14_1042230 [marine sediment metagenome]|uniref:Uncharacterized protein n=1 Tax=marine sediment metagenome TaxID=412755 RepID=A0A0F9QXP0_9ZZZZ